MRPSNERSRRDLLQSHRRFRCVRPSPSFAIVFKIIGSERNHKGEIGCEISSLCYVSCTGILYLNSIGILYLNFRTALSFWGLQFQVRCPSNGRECASNTRFGARSEYIHVQQQQQQQQQLYSSVLSTIFSSTEVVRKLHDAILLLYVL